MRLERDQDGVIERVELVGRESGDIPDHIRRGDDGGSGKVSLLSNVVQRGDAAFQRA